MLKILWGYLLQVEHKKKSDLRLAELLGAGSINPTLVITAQGKNTAVCCFFGPRQQADVDKVGTISFLSKLCRINQSCAKNRKIVL